MKVVKMKPVTVILPTLNERENIIALIAAINKDFKPQKIIVVDDASADGTAALVKKYRKKAKNLKLIRNSPPLGLTASIMKAIDQSKSRFVAWMDADFSHPPKLLDQMYAAIGKNDILVGSWRVGSGRDKRTEKLTLFTSFVINKLCTFLFSPKITAYTSGFVLCRKSVFKKYRLCGDYGEYFIHFVVSHLSRSRLTEVPFVLYSRKRGLSKTAPNFWVFLKRGSKYLLMILSLFYSKIINKRG